MSGILGLWNLDGRPADQGGLAALSATIAHRGRDAAGVRVDGDAGLACRLARVTPESAFETQPVVDGDGAMLVFDGRIDNRDELESAVGPRIHAGGPADSVLALAAYRAFGDGFPARLAGDFALGLFDSRRRLMILARDAVGVRPLYYFVSARLFLFASEMKAIVSHPDVEPRPDDDALADALFTRGVGTEPGDRTVFANIVSVPPAHAVVAGPNGVRAARYWDFDVTRRVRFRRAGDYAAAFREQFDRAVRRRLRSVRPVAVAVSGGLDSSAVFCTAHALARNQGGGPQPPTGVAYTFPDGAPSDEKIYLAEVERACGSPIVRLHDPPIGVTDVCGDAVWHAEGPYIDSEWNATHAQMTAVRAIGAGVLLGGHWGDQLLFDDAYLVDLWRRGRWPTAWRHVTTYSGWMDVPAAAFKRRFAVALLKYHVPDTVISALRRLRNVRRPPPPGRAWYTDDFVRRARRTAAVRRRPGATAHAGAIYGEVRSQYAVSGMELISKIAAMHGLEMAFPFLDRDLIAFLMAIPGEMQTRDGVPKALLREGCRDVMPEAIVRRTSKADFTHRANAGVARDRDAMLSIVRNGLAVERQYVRRNAVDAIAACSLDAKTPDALTAWALCDLFALELWLREFVGPERRCQQWRTLQDVEAI